MHVTNVSWVTELFLLVEEPGERDQALAGEWEKEGIPGVPAVGSGAQSQWGPWETVEHTPTRPW